MSAQKTAFFPGVLFERGRQTLERFGYRQARVDDWFDDWEEMWAKLKADFATPEQPDIPSYSELTEGQQDVARAYMEARLAADRRLIACEKAHREMYAEGINNDLVELYTAARESYEDSVDHFGELREKVEELLAG